MIYHGQVKNGRIHLNGSARLPEGAQVTVQVVGHTEPISRPAHRARLGKIEPIRLPGGSLADELVHDRR